jgi:hypothetical protein
MFVGVGASRVRDFSNWPSKPHRLLFSLMKLMLSAGSEVPESAEEMMNANKP